MKRDFVLVGSKSKIRKVYVKDVYFLRKANNYTEMVLSNGEVITICKNLARTVSKMSGFSICVFGSNYAPNLDNITHYVKENRTIYFSEEVFIVIPEKKVKEFYEYLEKFFIVL